MNRGRVLIAGADLSDLEDLIEFFIKQKYFIIRDENPEAVLVKLGYVAPDVIILDLEMLPSSLKLCERIRNISQVPIILLGKNDDTEFRIGALNIGADVFLVKPVNYFELMARIKALLRRRDKYNQVSSDYLSLDNLEINLTERMVRVDNRVAKLAPKEIYLLWQLALSPCSVLHRNYLLDKVWGYLDASDTRTVDTHIRRLRKALSDLGACWEVRTVHGVGYKLSRKKDKVLPFIKLENQSLYM